MRYHLVLPFIGWLFKKTFSGVFKLNKNYRREMCRNPGLGLFIGAICSLLFVAAVTIVSVIFSNGTRDVITYSFLSAAFISVSYVLGTFFSILFEDFLEERQELFDMIKDDRIR